MTETIRLTTAQALVRFLASQYSERDGLEQRLIPGAWGVFGHGNASGIGQALLQAALTGEADLPYYVARNEQGMVHAAVAFARMRDRLAAFACTASTGPGSTNMIAGAALATANRLPVLLLPGEMVATRGPNPVLHLEATGAGDITVSDAFRSVSKFFDRITRPEQLIPAATAAMRVLTDPVETGAVTLVLPQDVQAEASDWPVTFFRRRVWRVGRPVPEPAALARASHLLREAKRPLIVAGGGVVYSGAETLLRAFSEATGIPVAETGAGKGAVAWDHPYAVGGIGPTGSYAAQEVAREADVVLGIGTRYSDLATAGHAVFGNPDVTFVNLNVARLDSVGQSAEPLVADARLGIQALVGALTDWEVGEAYRRRTRELVAEARRLEDESFRGGHGPLPATADILRTLNEILDDRDVVINAAGSVPGDLQQLWRARDPKAYHVEYAYSCLGYEVAAGVGAKLADPSREVVLLVGDASYLMMAQEIAGMVSEGMKVVIVLVQNRGFASVEAPAELPGPQWSGAQYRFRDGEQALPAGGRRPVDLAANAASLGADVLHAATVDEFRTAVEKAKAGSRTTVVHVETDPCSVLAPAPGNPDAEALAF
ncbi:3D-(3,5/4)-trihydroxycyclohexane-1,2-dione acylhydrolase (decyclizing) [Streptomyces sp. NPDC002896]|uniref:3D-(3,5/4)-trihydroxycyclohexane-1,2-dione acylhydrolase (decyclizing) n=1 Tax=Streptomyces sp. NPDC002896 TaxID=3154438 RepID=UPI0033242C04